MTERIGQRARLLSAAVVLGLVALAKRRDRRADCCHGP